VGGADQAMTFVGARRVSGSQREKRQE
jgi:hypothetical protein